MGIVFPHHRQEVNPSFRTLPLYTWYYSRIRRKQYCNLAGWTVYSRGGWWWVGWLDICYYVRHGISPGSRQMDGNYKLAMGCRKCHWSCDRWLVRRADELEMDFLAEYSLLRHCGCWDPHLSAPTSKRRFTLGQTQDIRLDRLICFYCFDNKSPHSSHMGTLYISLANIC